MKLKSISKKLIICLCVFLLLFNFLMASVNTVSLAATTEDPTNTADMAADAEEEADSLMGGFLNGLAGILTWIPRALMNICSMLCQTLAYFVIDTAGHGENQVSTFLTPFDIFFNKFTLTNINIFQTEDIENSSGGDLVYNIRETAAMLYYIVRAIAIGILLIMLLMIGIKMAIASLAEEKAKLKNMFFDWLVSVCLVILMHMIILAVISVNEFLVNLIAGVAGANNGVNVSSMVDSLRSAAFSGNFLLGWGSTIAYGILTVQTMAFVAVYIVRLFKVIFLIVLSPIMPLTYALDRAKGGQAVSLNGWLREFIYNVFIQVIHCIIYVVIIAVPMSAINTASIGSISSLTQPLILVIALMFVKKAEELLKSLFGFDKSTTLTSFSSVVNNSQRAILTGVSIANGTYTVNNNVANNTTTFGSNIQTLGERASNKVHEYRDRAVGWLEGQERAMADDTSNPSSSSSSGGYQDEEDDDNIIDAEYKELDEEGNPIEDNDEPIIALLPDNSNEITDEDADKVAAAVASTKHDHDKDNEDDDSEETEESEVDETEIHHVGPPAGLPPRDNEQLNELKKQYEEIMDGIRTANDLQKELEEKLDDLETELDDESADILRKQIEELMQTEGEKSAKSYADSFGDSPEGKYAQEYFNYLSNQKALNDMTYGDESKLVELVNNAVNAGLITDAMGNQLFDNAINVANGEDDKTNDIIKTQEVSDEADKDDRDSVEVDVQEPKSEDDVPKADIIDITRDIRLSKAAFNSVMRSTRSATINNAKLLEAIDGEINVEGDFSKASLLSFNTKVLEKARAGAYSQSNFKRAEEAVKREGDIAVRRLEKFKAEQTEANARMLTPAGRQYAELMIEAQQAGMFITSASISERGTSTSYSNQSMSVSRQTMNIQGNSTGPITTPSDQSNLVINDLSRRKRA